MTLSLVGLVAVVLHASQTSARNGVATRFTARAGLAAKFVSTYAGQLATREQKVASATLATRRASTAFTSDVNAFGFRATLLLDSEGRVLDVAPTAPKLIGQRIAPHYAHLAAAVNGQVAVSNVVLSAAHHTPVIAFAVPFSSPYGRRVFSGAYAVSDTPITAFLNDISTLKGAQLFIVDAHHNVVATNGPAPTGIHTLAQQNPALSHATSTRSRGSYQARNAHYSFAQAPVAGTPWSLIIAAPTVGVFAAVNGANHWGPWLILAALAIVAALAGGLGIRQFEARSRLAEANHQLDLLASTDSLTGLANRRHLNEQLERLLSNMRRHAFPVSVLMIDIDHFKRLNDNYGHHAGDQAIRHITQELAGALREGDILARWGGEEFLAVLPDADLSEALTVAERLRHAIAGAPMHLGDHNDLVAIQTSVGVAQATNDDDVDTLVSRADHGLYDAKAAGRNTIRAVRS